MKILLIKLNKIGDVLLTSPLFANLKAHFKNCTLDLLVNANTEGLVDMTHVRHIFTLERPTHLIRDISLLFALRKEHYDLVLGLTYGERTAFSAFFSGAKVRVGFPPKSFWSKHLYTHKIPYRQTHTIEANLDALRVLKIPIISKCVRANVAKNSALLENLPTRFIHCHFFSDWDFKCPNEAFCAQVVQTIIQTYSLPCVLTAGPFVNELKKLQIIQSHLESLKDRIFYFAGNLKLNEVALLNSKALAFVGVDTSIMHLSAANAIPTFAFFGPTVSTTWGPWDNTLENSTYTNQKGGIQRMGKHCIYQENLPCIPCGKAGCENSGKSDCLLNINYDSALSALRDFLHPILTNT